MEINNCTHCGGAIEFRKWMRPSDYRKAQFCSRACSSKSRALSDQELILNATTISPTGCWEWGLYRDKKGYGRVAPRNGEVLAHRVSWTLFRGPIPKGLHACHKCDNPGCVNPDHIFLGTNDDNQADKIAKGRHRGATGELNCKAKLTEADVLAILQDSRSHAALGRQYGVTYSSISAIRAGRTWKHVPRKVAA